MKRPFAATSWLRGTSRGIIESSAGAKKVVTIDTKMFSAKIATTLRSKRTMTPNATARRTFVTTSSIRPSRRSTKTPAMAEKITAGTRNVSRSSDTAELEFVASNTRTVRP